MRPSDVIDGPSVAPARLARSTAGFARAMTLAVVVGWISLAPCDVVAGSTAPRFSRADVARIDRLLVLIQKRLEYAPALAEARWRSMSRIEDTASEKQLLDAARQQAATLKLDAELAARFAQAQIDAAKIIQAERHKHWAKAPGAAPAREKASDPLRASVAEPELDASLLKAWRDALPVLRRPASIGVIDARAADLIHVGGSDLLAAQAALRPLYEIANQNRDGSEK